MAFLHTAVGFFLVDMVVGHGYRWMRACYVPKALPPA